MRVIQDGREAEIEGSYADAEALLLPRLAQEGSEPRVVVRMQLDGREVSGGELGDLSTIALGDCRLVEVETAAVGEIARRSLESAAEFSERVKEALCHTAGLMRSDRPEVANEHFAEVLDGMSVLFFTLQAATSHLGPEAQPIVSIGERIEPWLDAITDAQLAQDWIRVADYLEYEIAPVLAEARGTIGALCAAEGIG